ATVFPSGEITTARISAAGVSNRRSSRRVARSHSRKPKSWGFGTISGPPWLCAATRYLPSRENARQQGELVSCQVSSPVSFPVVVSHRRITLLSIEDGAVARTRPSGEKAWG